MPEYLSPGVYVEEISTGPRPIEGVSTSTAGFVGQTEKGPEYPLLVSSWVEYQRWFGSYLGTDVSYLPYAVQGFFDNGGQRLFVARVVPGISKSAGNSLPTRAQFTAGDLTLMAVGRGDWGNRIFVAIEEASKARTAAPGSPVKNWIKLTLLYYSRLPKSRAFQVFDTAAQVNVLTGQTTAAAAKAVTAAGDANTAITTAEGPTSTPAEKQAAVDKANESKAAAQALLDSAARAGDAIKEVQKQVAAALLASPGDAKLQGISTAADDALQSVESAKTAANQAVTDTGATATENPPTSGTAATAVASVTAAQTAWTAAVGKVKTLSDGATDAYPALAAGSLAGQAQDAATKALQAAQAAQPIIDASVDDSGDPAKKAAAQTAAQAAKDAAQAFKDAASALQAAVDKTKSIPDVGTSPVVNDAVAAAQTAADGADNVLQAANTAGTEPFSKQNSQASVDAATQAEKDTASAVTAVQGVGTAVQAAAPVVLAVNPMLPENQLDPDFRDPDQVEVYDNIRIPAGASNSLAVTLNGASQLVVAILKGTNVPLSNTEPGPGGGTQPIFTALAGGAASTDANGQPVTIPTLADFQGTGDPVDDNATLFGNGTGLAGLAAIEGISLLAAPDEVLVDQLSQAVINQCELLRDRFGVISSVNGRPNVTNVNPIQDTTYAAFYYPWVWVFDPATNGPLLIPPTGHVTGLIARTDIERGVHKAPANEILRDVIDLEFPISKAKQDILNPKGVNCVRDFRPQGRSIRLWGARTMTSDPEWRYINVRRLFIFVEQSILRGTNWVVFEPNDQLLWAKVRLSISAFLTTVWKSGALMGTTADEAFFVRCDRTTMTQNEIDTGRLICLIGIAPVKPAEFVIFRISQKMPEAVQ
jgi:uncharacterized protein